jgi:excinuclease ABC subunit A
MKKGDSNNGFDETGYKHIEVFGAREHNLKNIDVLIPRNKLIVITGVSGSGKSSLAFDTLYAEGQRRYLESFSAYARSFIGDLERPDVDKVNGLSPVISIEQKTTSRNPRSTVGTLTEIYDFLRLFYARAGEAFSYITGKKMVRQSEDQIKAAIIKQFRGQMLTILAPVVKGRKGHYKELFKNLAKSGFSKVRVDGDIQEIKPRMQLDRYKTHDVEVVIDRIEVDRDQKVRLGQSIELGLKWGKGSLMVINQGGEAKPYSRSLMDPVSGISYEDPAPNTFSFNSPYGACPTCNGLGYIQEFTRETLIPDDNLSIARGGLAPLGEYRDIWIFKLIESVLKTEKYNLSTPIKKLPFETLDLILNGSPKKIPVPSTKYPGTFWNAKFKGVIQYIQDFKGFESSSENKEEEQDFKKSCPECGGARLKKEALHFFIDKKSISEISAFDISKLGDWFDGIESRLNDRQNRIAEELLKEIRKRIGFLNDLGLGYLTLDRTLKTLSGGESQRIRLATQIGTQLVGVLYILDEPSIGLHQKDNNKLINSLKKLRDLGNTVIVVEHDKDMMLQSDYIIDIGPGAGRHGGEIVAQGEPSMIQAGQSETSNYLLGIKEISIPTSRRKGSGNYLELTKAKGHNLQNIDLKIPLGTLNLVTGVSGSGKSTLIHETLYPALQNHLYKSKRRTLAFSKIKGLEYLDKVIEIDQRPIGRTPRSNPATYTGFFSDIRNLFSQLPEAKIRGYKPGRFSFNVKGGRCEECRGGGMKLIEMDFLPSVLVHCETCKGRRYNRETLEVRFKGKSISDVLDMTVNMAVRFFENQPRVLRVIQTLKDVGLGYITLGQHATTLSGGEAQRVKLASELSKKDTGKTFYILDEPTTGLHFSDINMLMDVLNKLVDRGNTVLIIEHNLDVIKLADHITDLGPDGGRDGGKIIAEGTPEGLAKISTSYTGNFLKRELKRKAEPKRFSF